VVGDDGNVNAIVKVLPVSLHWQKLLHPKMHRHGP